MLQMQLEGNYIATECCDKVCNAQDNLRMNLRSCLGRGMLRGIFTLLRWDKMGREGECYQEA